MKTFGKRVPKKKLFSEYVRIMNGIFGLSKREAEMYAFMMKLDYEWRSLSEKDFKNILSTSNRRLIVRECNVNKTNLSRLIAELKRKGLLYINDYGGYEIPPSVALNPNENIYEIAFTLEVADESTGQNNK